MAPLLLIEPIGGIAGDMFLAAALDLGVDRAALEAALRTLGVPGWRLEVSRREASGIAGTHLDVVVEGPQPPRRPLQEILGIIGSSGLPARARATAAAVFQRIGRAEAKVHGVPLDEVHFHEIGAVDSIVDVCGAAVALDLLGWPRVVSSVPELGTGMVQTAHGAMPVPPPAVLELLAGKPIRLSGPPGEAVTPTGAALLAELAEVGVLPPISPERVGYGVGTVEWPDRPNVLRMVFGKAPSPVKEPGEPWALSSGSVPGERDGTTGLVPGARERHGLGPGEREASPPLWVLEANLDDVTGQLVARAIEACLEVGALDAWAAPLTMKKGRPGILLGALAAADRADAVARTILLETTTLGVRRYAVRRDALERALVPVDTVYGTVRMKVARMEGREVGAQPEYDDCLALAREKGVPVKEVLAAAIAAHRAR